MNDEKIKFEKNKVVYESAVLKFMGTDGFDVYNCSSPFVISGIKYMYGRLERRNEWARSYVGLFYETEKDTFSIVPDAMKYQLEDPFVTFINGELIMGGTNVVMRSGKYDYFNAYFYKGKDIKDMRYFTTGPNGMKDIRLVQIPQGIGLFSRPSGKVGFTVIKSLEELTAESIQDAPMINFIYGEEYGGCNDCYYLGGGYIGIIGHKAYAHTDDEKLETRVYVNTACVMNIETRKVSENRIIGTRSCYPITNEIKINPNKDSKHYLEDVVFSSGIVLRKDGKVDLYSGLSDAQEGRITIDDPFKEYRNK